MRSRLAIAIISATLATPAFADLINFDDIPAGRIGEQYRSRGVMFFVGNGEYGSSTGILVSGGQPVTAWAGPVFTAVSWPNIMNPSGGAAGIPTNSDILVHFFDGAGNRT